MGSNEDQIGWKIGRLLSFLDDFVTCRLEIFGSITIKTEFIRIAHFVVSFGLKLIFNTENLSKM